MTAEVLTTEVPGNTKPGTSFFKARSFQITLNQIQYYNNIKDYLTNLKTFSYLISCKEYAPTTNKEHIHIYTHFTQSIKLSIKKLKGAHLEKCRGTPEQNINYITKDGNILDEIGIKPHQGKKNFNYNEINNLTTQDILNNEDLNLIQKKTLLNIKKDISNQPIKASDFLKSYYKKNNHFHIFYITGPSGCGKTRYALKLIQDYINFYGDTYLDEIDANGQFINGAHQGAEICLFDEFRDYSMDYKSFLKFIDYNKHTFNIKGSYLTNNYKLIILTSVISIENIYLHDLSNEETYEQLKRRIIYINFYDNEPNFNEPYDFTK